jgi:solute carrier family 8 (sodium/calcium exchanger)
MLAGLLMMAIVAVHADEDAEAEADSGDIPEGVNCGDGLLIPIWRPYERLSGGDRFGRGVLYILLMVWLFIGVSIVSDRFMESIEMITAQEKEVTIKDPKTGKNQIVIVKVWNETVANLTLMALGKKLAKKSTT